MNGAPGGAPDRGPGGASEEEIRAEAAAWLARMGAAPDPATRRSFAAWLEADPRHADAWGRLNATWELTGRGSDAALREDAAALAGLMARVGARRRRRAARRGAALVALLVALGAGGGWWTFQNPNFLQDLRADEVSGRGERRGVTLPDGSTALLDADSAIATDFGDGRRVRLLRGAAHFDVRHDATPFVVAAGDGAVTVMGTAFDVALDGAEVSVTLARGRVSVTAEGAPAVVLEPGERVDYGPDGIGAPRAVDLAEAQAWQHGWYAFNDVPLARVVARIERQRPGRVVILGPGLADRRVSGAFSLDRPDQGLEALSGTMGVPVRRFGSALTVIGP
ncbi:MAG: Fe2+-dicitrate sensor, membrane component [Rhodovulum sulfidophilum]|uniref:Fe2+-dicitrate sensor, membrane component n=1 Tax=Rhodovulum sulfidophilum TaxID=35806 RepID=A0A2W5NB14_RHOSU|nr:MAG: Fe2+-dicitrate sensor, membrane component [Rhodovulum sulfidophilum]